MEKISKDDYTNTEREQLRQDIIEGCREMAEVNLQIEREFHPLEEEVDRLLLTEQGIK